MNAAGRLGIYAAGLGVVFAGAFGAAGVVVPDEMVTAWAEVAETPSTIEHATGGDAAQGEYLLREVSAPGADESEGERAFTLLGPDGRPVTDVAVEHEQELPVIVVSPEPTTGSADTSH